MINNNDIRNIFFYLKDMFGVATPARLKMIILGFHAYIWMVRLGLNNLVVRIFCGRLG